MSIEIENGDLVKDHITGFVGIVIGITDWLYGCRRAVVQPRELNKEAKYDTMLPKGETFDIPQLEILEKNAVPNPGKPMKERKHSETTGGPMPNEHLALKR